MVLWFVQYCGTSGTVVRLVLVRPVMGQAPLYMYIYIPSEYSAQWQVLHCKRGNQG